MYMGDVLTSLVKVFSDLAFSLCYFGTGEFLNGYYPHRAATPVSRG